jgi:hypothetical protein
MGKMRSDGIAVIPAEARIHVATVLIVKSFPDKPATNENDS